MADIEKHELTLDELDQVVGGGPSATTGLAGGRAGLGKVEWKIDDGGTGAAGDRKGPKVDITPCYKNKPLILTEPR